MKFTYLILTIIISSLANGQHITSLYFNVGSSKLTTESQTKLDSLFYNNVLSAYDGYRIVGYADNTGDEKLNDILSMQRANAVAQYMFHTGLDSNKIRLITGKGAIGTKGQSEQQNRRVDIIKDNTILQEKTKEETPYSSLKVGDTYRLKDLNFIAKTATIIPKSLPVLEGLVKFLNDNPKMVIQIEGHVHYRKEWHRDKATIPARDSALHKLSEDRAKKVYDYLIIKKIDSNRLSYKGFSYSKVDESSYDNKRVEIRIISN